MKDLLDNALSEISDRYIEETVTYKPKTKSVSFRKILLVTACFILVIVSTFAVKDYFAPEVTQTTDSFSASDSPHTTIAGVIDKSTTVAYAPPMNTTASHPTTSAGVFEINLYCTTPMQDYTGWENMSFQSFYHCIDIGGTYYYADYVNNPSVSGTDEPIANEQLGKLLYEFNRSDYRFQIDGSGDFLVEVYELKGYSKDEAVAVGRKDGLMKGFYAYYRAIEE